MDDGWKPAVESSVEHQILIFTMNESILIFSNPEASNDLICALILSSSHRKLMLFHISVPLRFKLYLYDKKFTFAMHYMDTLDLYILLNMLVLREWLPGCCYVVINVF